MELPPALTKHHLPCSASACAQRVHIWGFLITQLALNIPLWNSRAFRAQPFRSVLLPKSHSSAELLVPGSCTYTGKGSAMPRKPGKWVCSIPQSLFGAHPAPSHSTDTARLLNSAASNPEQSLLLWFPSSATPQRVFLTKPRSQWGAGVCSFTSQLSSQTLTRQRRQHESKSTTEVGSNQNSHKNWAQSLPIPLWGCTRLLVCSKPLRMFPSFLQSSQLLILSSVISRTTPEPLERGITSKKQRAQAEIWEILLKMKI